MRKGSKHTEATRLKISQSHIGRKISKEHCRALHDGWRGKHQSDEAKRKIGLANSIPVNTEVLRQLYIDSKMTIKQVARVMGVSAPTIHRNLQLLGIATSCNVLVERKMPNHPRANKRGYVREHILAWEQAHGQSLPDGWVIHHLNGVKNDNRPENLVAMPNGNHCSGLVNEALRKRILELEAKLEKYANADDKTIRGECGGLVERKEEST